MLIEEKKLSHWIENFYGYGSWQAPCWFVGYEEGGGDLPEEVAEKINYFERVHKPNQEGVLSDIRDLYRHVSMREYGPKTGLFNNRYEYRFGQQAVQNSIWKNLIAFEHGYRNKNLPDLLAYQQQTFASPAVHNEAVIQLYPLPSPHNHAWYYSWLDFPQLSFLKSRLLYQERIYENRIRCILSNIKIHKPELVLMYGMNSINTLKKSVQDFFEGVSFKMIKGTKLQTPQHHRAEFHGTTLLITTQIPALRHNRIETGFEWEKFGKQVRRA
jgi:hypothetical protein